MDSYFDGGVHNSGTYKDSTATRRIMKWHLFVKVSEQMMTAVGKGWIDASRVVTVIY